MAAERPPRPEPTMAMLREEVDGLLAAADMMRILCQTP